MTRRLSYLPGMRCTSKYVPVRLRMIASGGADDRLFDDVHADFQTAEHARPQLALRIVDRDNHFLRTSLAIHFQSHMVDQARELGARVRGKRGFDGLPLFQETHIGLQHVSDNPELGWIHDVKEVIRGTDQLADPHVGMHDDATERTGDGHVLERLAGLFHLLNRGLVAPDGQELLSGHFQCRRLAGESSLSLQECLACDDSLLIQCGTLIK